jgi:hypothetical protein
VVAEDPSDQHGPHATLLPPHETAADPSAQVTLQLPTFRHWTWHDPLHSTVQELTWLQVTTLAGPTRTPQVVTFEHSYTQRAPQKAPQDMLVWHDTLQSSPQSEVQSLTSWQVWEQSLPHTAPQWLALKQVWSQPSPSQPR